MHAERLVLRHVVPVGVELDVGPDHQLFLLALHLWDDRFQVVFGESIGTVGLRETLFEGDCEVTDDVGVRYRPTRGGSGGDHQLTMLHLTFVPCVAATARSLTVSISVGDRVATHVVTLPN